MNVFLITVGPGRFELYSEPPEAPLNPAPGSSGRFRRWAHTANVRWRELVDAARSDAGTGWFARTRNRIICRLAEMIAEQRTLWALGDAETATLLFPSTIESAAARSTLDRLLAVARRRHGFWLIVDVVLLAASAVLMPIPGPNILAYYVAFRVVGHFQSWRGARHALTKTEWGLQPDPNLAELASLVDLPRAAREPRVQAIAERLNLHRLSAYFERVAV